MIVDPLAMILLTHQLDIVNREYPGMITESDDQDVTCIKHPEGSADDPSRRRRIRRAPASGARGVQSATR